MKKLMTLIVLLSLASCGRTVKTNSVNQQKTVTSAQEAIPFVQPEIGFYRSLTVDSTLSGLYENLTVNPQKQGKVLGDKPFYILSNESVFPSFVEYNLNFYSGSNLKSVSVFDIKNVPSLNKLTMAYLPSLRATNIIFDRDDFIWGKKNLDNPSMDMLNKAYVLNIESMDNFGSNTYKALSTYLVWFECEGQVAMVKDLGYTCGTYGLKFHYKILDYKLEKTE